MDEDSRDAPVSMGIESHMADQRPSLALLFQALADPTRLRVVEALCGGPARAGVLAEPFELAVTSFLRQLRVLEAAGVAGTEKAGRVRMVRLNPKRMAQAADWFRDRRAFWDGRLDRLARLPDQSGNFQKG